MDDHERQGPSALAGLHGFLQLVSEKIAAAPVSNIDMLKDVCVFCRLQLVAAYEPPFTVGDVPIR